MLCLEVPGNIDYQMAGQIQIMETMRVVFAYVQCLKSTGQDNGDKTLLEWSGKRKCPKTAWHCTPSQTLIDTRIPKVNT